MAIYADAAPSVAGSTIMLTILALLTYGLRVYCRLTRKSWGMEDWIMTAALVPFAVLVAGCIGGAFNGIGILNSTFAEPGNEEYEAQGKKFFLIFEVGYCAAIIPIKLSISWMLIRVASGRKEYLYAQYAIIATFVVMNIIALIFILTNCIPVEAAWDADALKNGHCQPGYVLADVYYACTAVNILTDWVTAFLPVPLLWNVQINRNTKISIIGLMGLGVFASLSACVRLKYTVALTSDENYLYGVSNVVIWGFAENAIGMLVGNIATLRPLFRVLRDRKYSDYKNSPGYISSHRTGGVVNSRNYELADHGKNPNHTAITSVVDRERLGSLSDGDSQKDILENGQPPGEADIVVNRQVIVAYN